MLGLFFFVILLGGLCISRRSRDDGDDDDDEWETYMSTRNGIFFFFQLYISCAANRFFFSFSPTQEVIRVKIATYVGFVVVAVGGRGPCRGLGSSVLNRCLVVRKGIAEMVADASTHAVMYQVEGTRRYSTIRLPTNPNMFFLQLSSRIFESSVLRQKPPPFNISYEQFAYESLKFGGPSWPQWKIHPLPAFLHGFA